MKRYQKYKDSGVEWIGEIPVDWEVHKLKRHFTVQSGDFLPAMEVIEGEYPIFGGNGIRGYADKYNFEGKTLLIGRVGALCGNIHLASGKFWFSEHALRVIPLKSICLEYFAYLLKTINLNQFAIQTAQPLINKTIVTDRYSSIPPLFEQQLIANHLDHKTHQIDTLIEKKQKQIEFLKEQRTAIINHAVTKGLNPDAKMKDSGIEWLGEIPAHWDVVRNKVIFTEVNDRSESGKEELLTVSHITGVTPRKDKEVTMFLSESLIGYKLCEKGDLIINTMWAWMGALGITDYEGVVSPSYNVYRAKDKKRVFPKFYDFLYRTPASVSEITRHSKGIWSSRLRLYPEIFFNILTLVPPYSEQKEIVNYLQNKTNIIEKYISENKKMIDFLTEYRTTLLSDAVTGKIDVRNEVPS